MLQLLQKEKDLKDAAGKDVTVTGTEKRIILIPVTEPTFLPLRRL